MWSQGKSSRETVRCTSGVSYASASAFPGLGLTFQEHSYLQSVVESESPTYLACERGEPDAWWC
jgi:hypothetical protein